MSRPGRTRRAGTARAPARAFRSPAARVSRRSGAGYLSPAACGSIPEDPTRAAEPTAVTLPHLSLPAAAATVPRPGAVARCSMPLLLALIDPAAATGSGGETLRPGDRAVPLSGVAAAVAEATGWHILPCLRRPSASRGLADAGSAATREAPCRSSRRRSRKPKSSLRTPAPVDSAPAVAVGRQQRTVAGNGDRTRGRQWRRWRGRRWTGPRCRTGLR